MSHPTHDTYCHRRYMYNSKLSSSQWNTSHKIEHIGFGDDYPGLINPLDNSEQISDKRK